MTTLVLITTTPNVAFGLFNYSGGTVTLTAAAGSAAAVGIYICH